MVFSCADILCSRKSSQLEVRKSARSTIPEMVWVLVTVVPMYSSQPDKNHKSDEGFHAYT